MSRTLDSPHFHCEAASFPPELAKGGLVAEVKFTFRRASQCLPAQLSELDSFVPLCKTKERLFCIAWLRLVSDYWALMFANMQLHELSRSRINYKETSWFVSKELEKEREQI